MVLTGIERQNRRKVRVTFFYLFLVGAVLVASSIYVHRVISMQVDGRGRGIAAFFETLPFVRPQRIRGIKAAVLQSDFTADYLESVAVSPEARAEYSDLARLWGDELEKRNIAFEIISDPDIMNRLGQFNLLVLPMTISLSDGQVQEVKRFLSRGNGVIATHASGQRDERGRLRTWSLASDLTGSRGFRLMEPEQYGRLVSFMTSAGTPLSAGIPPRRKISVHTYDSPAGIRILEPRVISAGYWEKAGADSGGGSAAGSRVSAAYGPYLRGRFAWFGFTMRSVANEEDSWRHFSAVIENALKWASKRPVAGTGAWPGGERAAAVFAVEARDDFIEAHNIIRMFKNMGIEPTGIIPESPSEIDLAAIQRIALETRTAPCFAEAKFPELPQTDKERRIRQARTRIEAEFGAAPEGIIVREPPEEDITLANAAFRAGVNYVWLTGADAGMPRLVTTGMPQPFFRRRRQPVFFYGSSRALFDFYGSGGADSPRLLLRNLKKEADDALLTGGILYIVIRPEHIRRESLEKFMPEFIEYLGDNNFITASPARTADNWRVYENVLLSAEEDRPGRISLVISNTGGDRAENIPVYLYPSLIPDSVSIQAEKLGTPIPAYTVEADKKRIALSVRDMRANESRTYFISF